MKDNLSDCCNYAEMFRSGRNRVGKTVSFGVGILRPEAGMQDAFRYFFRPHLTEIGLCAIIIAGILCIRMLPFLAAAHPEHKGMEENLCRLLIPN